MALLLVSVLPSAAPANERFWNNPLGGDFHTPANWADGLVPESSSTAIFDLDAVYTVEFSEQVTTRAVRIPQGEVTFDLGGITYRPSLGDPSAVGEQAGDEATLFVVNGVLRLQDPRVGNEAGSTGSVIVIGPEARFSGFGELSIGWGGTGSLQIEQGATAGSGTVVIAHQAGSHGEVTVHGESSRLSQSTLIMGGGGYGSLRVEAGAELRSTSQSAIGALEESEGILTLTGAGTVWTGEFLVHIGLRGFGRLEVEDGGSANFERLSIGSWEGGVGEMYVASGGKVFSTDTILGSEESTHGTATISGPGSEWTANTLVLEVGDYGSGEVVVLDGGLVTTNFFHTARKEGSHAAVRVSGPGAELRTHGFWAGENGSTELEVDAGGLIYNTGWVGLGIHAGSSGTATVAGADSRWHTLSQFHVGNSGSGELSVTKGARIQSSRGSIATNDNSSGTVTLSGAGTRWTMSEDLRLGGGSSGITQGAGSLAIEDGAEVWVAGRTRIGSAPGHHLHLDEGTLNTTSFVVSNSRLSGNGTIQTRGVVLDLPLTFDSTAGTVQEFMLNDADRDIVIELDLDGSGVLGAGVLGEGVLNIHEGDAVESHEGELGYYPDAEGTGNVTGTGSRWTIAETLTVGRHGTGTLLVENGGEVANGIGYLGRSMGGEGSAVVSGADSLWTNEVRLVLGQSGNGSLRVESGGTVAGGSALLGRHPWTTGDAVITGEDSHWNLSGYLAVGFEGEGILLIENSAEVMSANGYIGRFDGATGSATITGPSSIWQITDAFHVAGEEGFANLQGTGELFVENDGTLAVGQTLTVWPTGTLVLDGGVIKAGHLELGEGTFEFLAGTLEVGGSVAGSLAVPGEGHLKGVSSLQGDLEVKGVWSWAAGDHPLEVDGDFILDPQGVLAVELNGVWADDEAPLLDIEGDALLNGSLQVSLADGVAPASNDLMRLLSAGGTVGFDLAGIDLPGLDTGLYWNTTHLETDGLLAVGWGTGDFHAWIQELAPDLPGPAQLAPQANPAGDGVSNLAKYAFGMDPRIASLSGLPQVSEVHDGGDGETYLTLTINRNPNATDMSIVPEVSTHLTGDDWSSGGEHIEIVQESPVQLVVRSRVPLSTDPTQFIRVRVGLVNE